MAGCSASLVKKHMELKATAQLTLSPSIGLVVRVGHPFSYRHAQSQYEPSLTAMLSNIVRLYLNTVKHSTQ